MNERAWDHDELVDDAGQAPANGLWWKEGR